MAIKAKLFVTLYNKPAQILEPIPKRYRSSVVSALISKALDDETLFEELSRFLTTEEINDLKDIYKSKGIVSYESRFSRRKNEGNTEKIRSKTIKESVKIANKKNKPNSQTSSDFLFIGFDDEN